MSGPIETKCAECGRFAAETRCSLCETARPELCSVLEIAEAIRADAERRANNYANDRIKADRENPVYSTDSDMSIDARHMRPGR